MPAPKKPASKKPAAKKPAAKKAAKSAPKDTTPAVAEGVDVIGDAGRAQVVAELIADLQTQRARNEAMMIANQQSEDDPCGLADEKGRPISFGQRQATLNEAESRLLKTYAPIRPAIEKLVAQIREKEAQAG